MEAELEKAALMGFIDRIIPMIPGTQNRNQVMSDYQRLCTTMVESIDFTAPEKPAE